jgi:arsenate reductase
MASERPLLLHNKATCSKCRGAIDGLRERGIEPELVDLMAAPPTAGGLADIARMAGIRARDLLRSGERAYAVLGLYDDALPDDVLFEAMAAHPELIERPIVIHDGRAVVARPPERGLELFDR